MSNEIFTKDYLTKKNKVSFAVSGFGQNLIIGFVNSYILYFYTDIFVISAPAVAAIMFAARIWDALNDPMMGTIVDRTHSKWGKMRPYLLFVTVPLAISTALLFLTPNFGMTGKIAYAAVTYIIWGMIYTVCDVPFWGLASSMTPNPKERLSFISGSRLVHSIGGAAPMLLLPIFIAIFGEAKGYASAGIFAAIFGSALFFLSFAGTEERCINQEKAPTLKECFKFLKLNKPMQSVVLSNILGFMRGIPVVAGMYIATYVVKSVRLPFGLGAIEGAILNTVIMAAWGVAGFVGMLFTKKISGKLNYKQIYFLSAGIGAFFSLLMLIIGANFYSMIVCLFFIGMPFGLTSTVNYAIIAESVDYVELKTKKRSEGVTVSFQTLMSKLTAALQTGIVTLALIVIGFVQPIMVNGEAVRQPQSAATERGLFILITVLPMLGWILSAVPMAFFRFVGKEREEVYEKLARQRDAQTMEN